MKLFLKSLFIVLIGEIITLSSAKTMKNSIIISEHTSKLQKLLIKILKDCKKDYDTVLIFADSVKMNFDWVQELQTDVSIISHLNLSVNISNYSPTKKIDAYVLIVQSLESVEKFYHHLFTMFGSIDVFMPVYVFTTKMCNGIYRNAKKKEMSTFEIFFRRMNVHGIVISYLTCCNVDYSIKLYTYNMFTDRAPQRWKRAEKTSEGRWTIYERDFIEDHICEELDFDRTKHLDGYPMQIAYGLSVKNSKFIGKFFNQSVIYKEHENLDPDQVFFIDGLITALNVNCTIYFNPPLRDYGESNSVALYLVSVLNNFTFDVFLSDFTLKSDMLGIFKGTYPMIVSEYVIMTHHQGYKTFVEKVRDFYGIWIISFSLFTIAITSVVIWLSKKNFFFTVFEITRLLIGQGILMKMNTFSLRIFFSMIFIYFLIIQATFNGYLAKFLTKPQLREHADTLQDLHDLGYTRIYNEFNTKKYLAKTFHEQVTVRNLTKTCAEHILKNDTSAACVFPYSFLEEQFNRGIGSFHLSQKRFGSYYSQYLMLRGSPLRNRIYSFFFLLEELGLKQTYDEMASKYVFFYHKEIIQAKLYKDFRPIKIQDLLFIFIVLGFGLSCAACSFIVEMCIYYKKKKKIGSELKLMYLNEVTISIRIFVDQNSLKCLNSFNM